MGCLVPVTNNKIVVTDFGTGKFVVVDTKGGYYKPTAQDREEARKASEAYKKRKEKEFEDAKIKMNVVMNSWKRSNKTTTEWLAGKELKLTEDSEAFIKDEYMDKIFKGPVVLVPFKDARNDEYIGAQVCGLNHEGKSAKRAVTGTKLPPSYHLVNRGKRSKNSIIDYVLISESFSTALSLKRGRPNDTILCTAGIGLSLIHI